MRNGFAFLIMAVNIGVFVCAPYFRWEFYYLDRAITRRRMPVFNGSIGKTGLERVFLK